MSDYQAITVEIAKLALQPGEYLVMRAPEASNDQIDSMAAWLKEVHPDLSARAIILGGSKIELSIVTLKGPI